MYNQGETIRSWAEDNFGASHLSDERRIDRVVTISEAMASNPGKTIPQMFASTYDVKAAYNLFKHEEATPENLQTGHREKVLSAMRLPGIYLLVEDTTAMSWSGNEPIEGLGPIGDGKAGLQGFVIEEFHKALKTGLKAESLQLEHVSRLFAAISIKSVVALRLIEYKREIKSFGSKTGRRKWVKRIRVASSENNHREAIENCKRCGITDRQTGWRYEQKSRWNARLDNLVAWNGKT